MSTGQQEQVPAWLKDAVRLADSADQATRWAEQAARLAESAYRTTRWAEQAAQMDLARTSPWAEAAVRLAESMKTPAWAEAAARLADLARTSPWAESVSSLTSALEDPAWVESFVTSAGVTTETTPTGPTHSPPEVRAAEPLARKRRHAVLLTTGVYLAAALALHLSNFMSTYDPVFDPHLFITDKFIAIGLALALFCAICAFWKI